jgi:hypothetical protein
MHTCTQVPGRSPKSGHARGRDTGARLHRLRPLLHIITIAPLSCALPCSHADRPMDPNPCSKRWGGVVGELSSTLDSLAADDLHAMFAPQLPGRAGELLRARNRLDAELTRTVREWELTGAGEHDGLQTMQSWLRGHARPSQGAAAGSSTPAGRWSTCRRSPVPSPTGR